MWYRTNESMERNVNRDRHQLPDLDSLMRASGDRHLDAVAGNYAWLMDGTAVTTVPVRSLVRLELDFGTWALLAGQGMTDSQIANRFRRVVAPIR